MNNQNICFLAQIALSNGITYYVRDLNRVDAATIEGYVYQPYIISVNEVQKIGNFGEGNQVGQGGMTLLFGQRQYGDSFNLDITYPWNNAVCTIKLLDMDGDPSWYYAKPYYTGLVKNVKIDMGTLSFNIDEINHKDTMILPKYTVEDYVTYMARLTGITRGDIPKDSLGKRVPMQFGVLTNTSEGTFGKGILVSDKIGSQRVVYDTENLDYLESLGMWESGSRRYFVANQDGEYTIQPEYNQVYFFVNSATQLNEDEDLTEQDGIVLIKVTGYQNLTWIDEEDLDNPDAIPELLSINIIAIDAELMLIVEKPSSEYIRVERGYGDSVVAKHYRRASIYQCSKFSARNLLSFSHTFFPVAFSNFLYNPNLTAFDCFQAGKFSNLLDEDDTNSLEIKSRNKDISSTLYANMDLRFKKIEDDFTCYGAYFIFKLDFDCYEWRPTLPGYGLLLTILGEGSVANTYCPPPPGYSFGAGFGPPNPGDPDNQKTFLVCHTSHGGRTLVELDTITTISRTDISTFDYLYMPNFMTPDAEEYSLSFTNLTDLNTKWKLNIQMLGSTSTEINYIRLYKMGFLIDFFASFVDKRLIGSLRGRRTSLAHANFMGYTTYNDVIVYPWDALINILTIDMGYSITDLDADSWRAIYTYYSQAYTETPTIALSYGIDDKEKGWDLCQNIASQFLMLLTKTDSGKIKLVNLRQLQDNSVYGYLSLTAYKVPLDDVIFSGDKRQISIQQTGTDRIRNVVTIKYARNNSTDEYQGSFPSGDDSSEIYTNEYLDSNHTFPESGIILNQARTNYYNGEKTEVFSVEAFAISSWTPAYELWKWHINDKAEVFFYISISLPYYHFEERKEEQYDIGDILYLDGIYQGITFNSSHLFVIRTITKKNQGREIDIEMKSVQPISSFTETMPIRHIPRLICAQGIENDFDPNYAWYIDTYLAQDWNGISGSVNKFYSSNPGVPATIYAPNIGGNGIRVSYTEWTDITNLGSPIYANDGTSVDGGGNTGVIFP